METFDINDDEDHTLKFKEISTTKMGETSVKYSSNPSTILGNGLTAIVYPGYHFGLNKPVAVKFIKRQNVRVENDQVNVLKIWCEIDQNINIVRLYDSYADPRNGLFLAMEKAERTFRKQIEKFDPFREHIVKWLRQVSKAVEYLHEKRVIHRDIKPDNILMFSQGGNKLVAKLADFGVSKMISSAERTGTFSNASGTLLWMAPEALENKNRRFKNTKMLDIFGLGMTMYFGLSKGGHPFSRSRDPNDFTNVLSEMTGPYLFPKRLEFDHQVVNDLLAVMMDKLPHNRPQISEVLSHCLFWNWEKEHQFLIRAAICLSNDECVQIKALKERIDVEYLNYFSYANPGKKFSWIDIAKENNFDIEKLLTNRKRKNPTSEYGRGEYVTKFLKLFRDKYVHYPEITPEGAIVFSDNDGVFCEEKYVKILTSACPGFSSVLYQVLSSYFYLDRLLPLSKIYFAWKLRRYCHGYSVVVGPPVETRQVTTFPYQLNESDINEHIRNAPQIRLLPAPVPQHITTDENLIQEYSQFIQTSLLDQEFQKRRREDDL